MVDTSVKLRRTFILIGALGSSDFTSSPPVWEGFCSLSDIFNHGFSTRNSIKYVRIGKVKCDSEDHPDARRWCREGEKMVGRSKELSFWF